MPTHSGEAGCWREMAIALLSRVFAAAEVCRYNLHADDRVMRNAVREILLGRVGSGLGQGRTVTVLVELSEAAGGVARRRIRRFGVIGSRSGD